MRNNGIDILKLLCAILIVLLHTPFIGKSWILPVTRCAVPCFLIISGFFIYNQNVDIVRQKMDKAIRSILKITLWATVLFFFLHLFISLLGGNYDRIVVTKNEWIKFFVFNDCPWGMHLWYLYAYLYTLIIFKYIIKTKFLNVLIWIVPFLLLADLVFGKYSMVLFGFQIPYICLRNFIFVGIPYFIIGYLLAEHKDRIMNINHIAIAVIVFAITSIIESKTLDYFGVNAIRDHYLSSTFLAISLFVLFYKHNKSQWILKYVKKGGGKISLYIYIFHPLFITFFAIMGTRIEIVNTIYEAVAPMFIIPLTIFFSIIFDRILQLLYGYKRTK